MCVIVDEKIMQSSMKAFLMQVIVIRVVVFRLQYLVGNHMKEDLAHKVCFPLFVRPQFCNLALGG